VQSIRKRDSNLRSRGRKSGTQPNGDFKKIRSPFFGLWADEG